MSKEADGLMITTASTGKKVLLVDDDEDLRQSLSEQLQLHEEFVTVEAGTSKEGLERAKGEYFDAILLDVGLPDGDGRDLCRAAMGSSRRSSC